MLGSYLLGILLAGWSLGLPSLLLVLAAVVAGAVVLAGSAVQGAIRAAALRISAGVAATYAAIDIGDLLSELDDWSALTMILVVVAAVGAAILLLAAWRLTGGDVARDVVGLASASGRSLPDRLVLLGGAAVLVGWVVLRAANASFSDTSALAVLLTVLVLAVVWIAGGGAGSMQWPVPASLVNVVLGALVGLLALNWLINVLDDIGDATLFDWVGLVVFIGGAAVLVVGAVLAMQPGRARAG
jgi:hypothetical protein